MFFVEGTVSIHLCKKTLEKLLSNSIGKRVYLLVLWAGRAGCLNELEKGQKYLYVLTWNWEEVSTWILRICKPSSTSVRGHFPFTETHPVYFLRKLSNKEARRTAWTGAYWHLFQYFSIKGRELTKFLEWLWKLATQPVKDGKMSRR